MNERTTALITFGASGVLPIGVCGVGVASLDRFKMLSLPILRLVATITERRQDADVIEDTKTNALEYIHEKNVYASLLYVKSFDADFS